MCYEYSFTHPVSSKSVPIKTSPKNEVFLESFKAGQILAILTGCTFRGANPILLTAMAARILFLVLWFQSG